MYSKSSTFLALASILAILAVLSIAINGMEGESVRTPFPSPAVLDSVKEEDVLPEVRPVSTTDVAATVEKTVNEPTESLPKEVVTPKDTTPLLIQNVNDESLRIAGYSDFVIKPKPFDGKLFGIFDISMLGSLSIIEKNIIEDRNGTGVNVLTVYEFELGNKDTTQEIYDYLKAKIKNELGITINENNQFGLSSFYVNSGVPTESAFLVVKTRSNVYALSYPKAKYGNKDYFVLTSALLKELI